MEGEPDASGLAEGEGVVDPHAGGLGELHADFPCLRAARLLAGVPAAGDLELVHWRAAADEQEAVHEAVHPQRPSPLAVFLALRVSKTHNCLSAAPQM